jgi:hypothetical protein
MPLAEVLAAGIAVPSMLKILGLGPLVVPATQVICGLFQEASPSVVLFFANT